MCGEESRVCGNDVQEERAGHVGGGAGVSHVNQDSVASIHGEGRTDDGLRLVDLIVDPRFRELVFQERYGFGSRIDKGEGGTPQAHFFRKLLPGINFSDPVVG